MVDRVLTVEADVEVIDLPPHLSGSAVAALAVCDLVIIPCGASAADVSATAKTLELVQRAREVRDGSPPALIVPTRIDWRTSAGRAIERALALFGEPVGPAIAQRVSFADSLGIGEWVGQSWSLNRGHRCRENGAYQSGLDVGQQNAPNSPAHQEIELLADIVRGVLRATEVEGKSADIHTLAAYARSGPPGDPRRKRRSASRSLKNSRIGFVESAFKRHAGSRRIRGDALSRLPTVIIDDRRFRSSRTFLLSARDCGSPLMRREPSGRMSAPGN